MKEENKNNGRGIFYGVIGVATLVVAIIGATFAYFTANQSNNNIITGNMASTSFGLKVEKVVDPSATNGMIPMSNNMVETAVNGGKAGANAVCVDDNGNSVCQIYKITVTNSSTATMFVDGYIALTGGSGLVTDYSYTKTNSTTMRWAQVFATSREVPNGESGTKKIDVYSTAGTQVLGSGDGESVSYNTLDAPDTSNPGGTTGMNTNNIKKTRDEIVGSTTISGNAYDTVKTNFIRVSDHDATDSDGKKTLSTTFNRNSDLTSVLVLSQQLQPKDSTKAVGDGKTINTDKAEYYFVVWLSETGNNQTAGATPTTTTTATNPAADKFFNGLVSFVSAQGSEVTATFSGYTAVVSDQVTSTP